MTAMFRGTPAIAATAFAGTPFAMKDMPGPLPMPTSRLSAVNACCSLASPAEAVGSHRRLQLGIAGGVRGFYLQAVLGEDAGLDTDVQRGEGPSEGHRLANAELFRGICWRDQEHDKQAKERTGKFGHGIIP